MPPRASVIIFAILLSLQVVVALEPVVVAPDGKGFALKTSNQPFVPWGFNYASNDIEDRWDNGWAEIEHDFADMKRSGANVARIHLQFPRFMKSQRDVNERALENLAKLLKLAERVGLYLDITGLASYRPSERAAWYDNLCEKDRWAAQGTFWNAVATTCKSSSAVFCYDLMNEPLSPRDKRESGAWYTGKLAGYEYLQFISLDIAGRDREQLAKEWVRAMKASIRHADPHHMITVGLLPTWNGHHFSGFVPEVIAPELDFVAVHIYPDSKNLAEAEAILKQFSVGKPVVIEETFTLHCSAAELRTFLLESRSTASGWIGHWLTNTDFDTLPKDENLPINKAIHAEFVKLFEELAPLMRQTAK